MIHSQLDPSDCTVVGYVRPQLLLDPNDTTIETLYTCEAEELIGDLVIRSWPAEVVLDAESPAQEVVDRFDRYERWASRHDVSLRPSFDTRTRSSIATDVCTETLITPMVCLAVYYESRLVGVVPHTDADTTHTVSDAIAAFRTGELPAPLKAIAQSITTDANDDHDRAVTSDPAAVTRTTSVSTSDRGGDDPFDCPSCDTRLVNVQGILTCPDCDWISKRETYRELKP